MSASRPHEIFAMPDSCRHFDQARPVESGTRGCEDCEKTGAAWGWCYVHEQAFDPMPREPVVAHLRRGR